MKATSAAVLAVTVSFLISCKETEVPVAYNIVSLSPAMTEVVFALGAGDLLSGVTTYCDFPEAARRKPKVGDFSNPSLERIVALKPSLVIVNLPEQNRVRRALEDLGIPVFATRPAALEDIYAEIESLAVLIGKKAQADSLCAAMRAAIKGHKDGVGRLKVYVELSPRPLVTVGRRSFVSELLSRAGMDNIFSDIDRDYPVVSQEEVVRRDPAAVIVLHPGGIGDRIGWSKIAAVRDGRIYGEIDPDLIMRPGPRLVLGFKELEKIVE